MPMCGSAKIMTFVHSLFFFGKGFLLYCHYYISATSSSVMLVLTSFAILDKPSIVFALASLNVHGVTIDGTVMHVPIATTWRFCKPRKIPFHWLASPTPLKAASTSFGSLSRRMNRLASCENTSAWICDGR